MDSKKLIESKEVLALTLEGKTERQIAKDLDVSRNTITRLKATNEYIELRERYNEMFIASAIAEHRNHVIGLQKMMPDVIANLVKHSNSENEKIALDANKFLLDRYHKMVSDIVFSTFNEMLDDYANKED